MDYCPITLRTECGDLILLLASTKTMLEKTYMINSKTGNPIQVGMIRPKIGDVLEVEGGLYKSSDQRHSKTMKYIKRITRTIKPRSISERYLL